MKLGNMQKSSYFIWIMLLGFFCFTSAAITKATETGYALKPAYGSNQIAQNGQIDVFGNSGQTIKSGVTIANQSDKDLKLEVDIYPATTSGNGVYTFKKGTAIDPTMKINLRKFVSPAHQVIVVKANSVQTANFNITIPTQKFTGYVMGGVTVAPYHQKAQTSLTSNGTLIKNKYSQGIPIKVRQARDNKKEPKFRVRTVSATANSTMKSRGVNANVQNYVDGYVGDLNAKATVTRRPDDHKFKVTAKAESQDVAPNSNYNFAIDWGKNPLQAGNYHLHMVYTTNDKTKSWTVDKNFTISDADAAKYNKLSGIKPNYMWLWILIAILALLLVLGLGIYFGRRNQNKNNMNN
ncbi:DUF3324 domain-containing protein [Bombilactobacillus bombi]|uniref:DUF3324 domain-containing protein n=1 Tax=Bombilactobacillus bombi TaxID=1303590 RepID=UPI0015E5FAD6|nr:DUF3324 domain-containing protein [Bombilactobacillus bombi]MBA1434451.1 DUF3324 domain-containing protein [Bombilactobacillus bombi]